MDPAHPCICVHDVHLMADYGLAALRPLVSTAAAQVEAVKPKQAGAEREIPAAYFEDIRCVECVCC